MKQEMVQALEDFVSSLEDEIRFIQANEVAYDKKEDLLNYIKENIIAQFEEDMK